MMSNRCLSELDRAARAWWDCVTASLLTRKGQGNSKNLRYITDRVARVCVDFGVVDDSEINRNGVQPPHRRDHSPVAAYENTLKRLRAFALSLIHIQLWCGLYRSNRVPARSHARAITNKHLVRPDVPALNAFVWVTRACFHENRSATRALIPRVARPLVANILLPKRVLHPSIVRQVTF